MPNTHLETAYQIGVAKAINDEGYKTAEELLKEAQDLGLLQPAPTNDAAAVASLASKIGK